MANPFCQREYVNTCLQTFCDEVMPQVVMRKPLAICQTAGAVETALTFGNFANAACGLLVLLVF